MRRAWSGVGVFCGAVAGALALYGLTLPEGYPWNASAAIADAARQGIPGLPHPVWRWFVDLFGGRFIALSCVAASVSAGLLGTMANRWLRWPAGVGLALFWTTLPWTWYRACTGALGVCLATVIVAAAWVLDTVLYWTFRDSWESLGAPSVIGPNGILVTADPEDWKDRRHGMFRRVLSWTILLLGVLSAGFSVLTHDYRYGAAASAYAKLVVGEADGRTILMNGLCDVQIARLTRNAVSLRDDDWSRSNLVAWVRAAFPGDADLAAAANIGPAAFVDCAVSRYAARFHAMDGRTSTVESWWRRWRATVPWLGSDDPFVPVLRRALACEGVTFGDAVWKRGDHAEAWKIYQRVFDAVEPYNPTARARLDGMLRAGYEADVCRLDLTRGARDGLMKGVRTDPPQDLKRLEERQAAMMTAYFKKDLDSAERIAREILANGEWKGFLPAHQVLGTALAGKGEFAAAEPHYRAVAGGKGLATPARYVLNDYAEVLRHLGRLAEAETYARRAVDGTEAREWIYRLTLAQVLRDARKNPEEMRALVDCILKFAPVEKRFRIRSEFMP